MDENKILEGIYNMQKQMNEIQKKMDGIQEKMDEGFQKVNSGLEHIEDGLELLAKKTWQNEVEIHTIKKQFFKIQEA